VTRATTPPFSNYSSLYSSSQPSTSPEAMISGTVHAADFCITAQRLLAATKSSWEMKKHDERPMTLSIPVPKGLRE
jgi:hypothetical protein